MFEHGFYEYNEYPRSLLIRIICSICITNTDFTNTTNTLVHYLSVLFVLSVFEQLQSIRHLYEHGFYEYNEFSRSLLIRIICSIRITNTDFTNTTNTLVHYLSVLFVLSVFEQLQSIRHLYEHGFYEYNEFSRSLLIRIICSIRVRTTSVYSVSLRTRILRI